MAAHAGYTLHGGRLGVIGNMRRKGDFSLIRPPSPLGLCGTRLLHVANNPALPLIDRLSAATPAVLAVKRNEKIKIKNAAPQTD